MFLHGTRPINTGAGAPVFCLRYATYHLPMTAQTAAAIAVLGVLLAAVVWIDKRCLDDLARTSDRELRLLNRNGWMLLIVFTFPVGPLLYLAYAKGR